MDNAIDRARLERALRGMMGLLVLLVPQDPAAMLPAALAPLRPLVARLWATWDLPAKASALSSRIAALPDDDLAALIDLIAWELLAVRGYATAARATLEVGEVAPPRAPTVREWDAIAALVGTLREPL